MSVETLDTVVDRIADILTRYSNAKRSAARRLPPSTKIDGKLYEAYVLARLIEDLYVREGLRFQLSRGSSVVLRSSGGPISQTYPFFDVSRNTGGRVGELWTDIEFTSLSAHDALCVDPPQRRATSGDRHELDIVMVKPRVTGYPCHENILLAVECKHRKYERNYLREVLGVRRELSLLQGHVPTAFRSWPGPFVNANPPSWVLAYCSRSNISAYDSPGERFGIKFIHERFA